MDQDLSERYNEGLVPPPEPDGGPAARLPRPAWQPSQAQVEAARKQAGRNAAILALLMLACLAGLALASGWRP